VPHIELVIVLLNCTIDSDGVQALVALHTHLRHCHHAQRYQLAFVKQTFGKLVNPVVVDNCSSSRGHVSSFDIIICLNTMAVHNTTKNWAAATCFC